jgi:hypothetical protein
LCLHIFIGRGLERRYWYRIIGTVDGAAYAFAFVATRATIRFPAASITGERVVNKEKVGCGERLILCGGRIGRILGKWKHEFLSIITVSVPATVRLHGTDIRVG